MEIYSDFRSSVEKALSDIDKNWKTYKGLIICGSHNPRNVEFLITKIKEARENKIPALLICFGHQLGAIEYARNILNIKTFNSNNISSRLYHDT